MDTPNATTHRFQAEVNEILHLVIHSLYSHKEIFLRELVSNASDALDRLRFRAVTEKELMADDPTLEIRIVPDEAAGTLTIEDTGVGLTYDELVRDLGTVARSGSRAFLEQLAAAKGGGEGGRDLSLIGQFGVGFYSAYLVADRVDVVSRAAGSSDAWRWSSDGKNTFTIERAERAQRGTSVVLHLKSDQKDFLDPWRLESLVRRYSDYVGFPIKLRKEKDDAELETINRASALWQRPKGELTEEQYAEFYKHLSHDGEAPLARAHFRMEGANEFVGLLFVPRHVPFELRFGQKARGLRLFVKRVLIMESCDAIVPEWMRFVTGVVDSDDLPLNVSREMLQESAAVRVIRKQVVKQVLDLLDDMAENRPDDYRVFWEQFGAFLKEGVVTDHEHRDRLAKLLRYASSRAASGDGALTSLGDYVKRMPEGQPAIYYVLGESAQAVAASPHVEGLAKRGWEVLHMTDAIDEWVTGELRTFDGKPLVSAMRADLKLADGDAERKQREEQTAALKPLLEAMKKGLEEEVADVRVSDRLTESPCCLVLAGAGPHAFTERLLRESGRAVGKAKRVLEVNASHPLIQGLAKRVEGGEEPARLREWFELLYDQAVLTEGSAPPDPARFAKRVTALLTRAVAP